MNNIYRHGDLFFRPVKNIEGVEVEHRGSFVLAEGETTGHKHVITAERMEIVQAPNGRCYLELGSEARVSHEEHKTIVIPPGKYEVGHEQEKDWFAGAVRRVVD